MTMITLPHDGERQFNLALLIRHLITVGRTSIVQGQQQVTLDQHTKLQSLDYFIRQNIAQLKDTAQSTTAVVDQICATGLFHRNENITCPDSGRLCQGIELADAN